jgi:hypothetical protein
MSQTTISKHNVNPDIKPGAKSYGWILVSIEEMIEESMYFCETFAHTLNVHHNTQAATVFEQAHGDFQQEKQLLLSAIDDFQSHPNHQNDPLPKISPWEKPYVGYQHPATTLMDADYLMTESEAGILVTKMIRVHHYFYDHLTQTQSSKASLKLVALLQEYCSNCSQNS